MKALRLYRALVVDTNDPEGAGRVRLRELGRARGKKPREGWVPVANYPIAGTFALRPPYENGDLVLYAAEGIPYREAIVICMWRRNAAAPLDVTLESSGAISLQSSSQLKLQASQLVISAASLQIDAGQCRFSGVVQCDTLIANSVVASSYTPGAGNIW